MIAGIRNCNSIVIHYGVMHSIDKAHRNTDGTRLLKHTCRFNSKNVPSSIWLSTHKKCCQMQNNFHFFPDNFLHWKKKKQKDTKQWSQHEKFQKANSTYIKFCLRGYSSRIVSEIRILYKWWNQSIQTGNDSFWWWGFRFKQPQ